MENFPAYVKLEFPYDKNRGTAIDRTPMEDGFVKQAKVKARVPVTRNVVILLDSAADYASFITFYNVNINRGADWFNWTDPETNTVKSARLVAQIDREVPVRKTLDRWRLEAKLETFE